MSPRNSYLTFSRRLSRPIGYGAYATGAMIAMAFAPLLLAQRSTAPAFPSPLAAADALAQAVQKNDEAAIEKVLGGPTDLASSHDESQDTVERETFLKKYQEMHRLHHEADGSVTLFIGAENWPFPIPLVRQGGAWHFDADSGGKEVLFRRIGENELEAIETCRGLVALPEAGDKSFPVSMHGYYFRILAPTPRSGEILAVAYPAEYRKSGVMTFIMTGNDVIYEKDLGVNTAALANRLPGSRKHGTWRRVTD